MICNNQNSITENLKEIENIRLTIESEKKYGFIEDKENEGAIKITNKKVFDNFIKECFNTALLYLIVTMLIPLLLLFIISKFKLNLGHEKSILSRIFPICLVINVIIYVFLSYVFRFVMNFSSFLTIFINTTIFLCFMVSFVYFYMNDNDLEVPCKESKKYKKVIKNFLLVFSIILIVLYLMNNFLSTTLIKFYWIMFFVSLSLLLISITILYINNKLNKKNEFNLCIINIFFIFTISFIISLCFLYKLEGLFIEMNTFSLKNIKWYIIGQIYGIINIANFNPIIILKSIFDVINLSNHYLNNERVEKLK